MLKNMFLFAIFFNLLISNQLATVAKTATSQPPPPPLRQIADLPAVTGLTNEGKTEEKKGTREEGKYNPQNETEDGNKSKWSKIKTKRDSPQNEAYLRVRFFNRPPYPIFAPKSTRLRRGQG